MQRTRAFTILEVALIVAIIGMMLMMIVGYLFAPKPATGPLPPITAPQPFIATPAPSTPVPRALAAPTPATPAPATPSAAPATPAPPTQTIDLSPQSAPIFR